MNETKREPANKGLKFPPSPPTPEEAARIIRACVKRPERPSSTGLRNAALLTVLWRAGLRCAEALALMPADLEPGLGQIRVREGKGGRSRVVCMDSDAWAFLGRWIERRERLGFNGRVPLFCSVDRRSRGRPLHAQVVRRIVAAAAARAGVQKRIAPHQFRHAHAVQLQRAGVPVYAVQAQLGHAHAGTTQVYLAGLNPEEVGAAVANVPWPALAALRPEEERAADAARIAEALTPRPAPVLDDAALKEAIRAEVARVMAELGKEG